MGVRSPEQAGLGTPDLPALFDLLSWAGREHAILLILHLIATFAPFVFLNSHGGRDSVTVALVMLVGVTVLKGDPSYQSRFMYLVPVLIAFLSADAIIPGLRKIAERLGRSESLFTAISLTALLLMLFQVGFSVRLTTAIRYYQRIEPDDLVLLEGLPASNGVVGSSHWSSSTAEPTNWFVNAAASREAWSPIGPWLSTIQEEAMAGQQMQRLFAGQVGIENEALQVAAAGTEDGYYSLQISVRSNGWYFPIASLDAARTRWPFPVTTASAELTEDGDLELRIAELQRQTLSR